MKRVEIMQKEKQKRNSSIALFLLLVAAAIVILALLVLLGGRNSGAGGEATIQIPAGATTADIADMLIEEDVIEDRGDFLTQAEAAGIDEQLQAGIYTFERGEPVDDILSKLKQGLQDPAGVITIPEGFSIYEIADLVEEKTEITREEYLAAINVNGRTLPLKGSEAALDLEGYLFPSTYNIDQLDEADVLVDMQLDEFENETGQLPWSKSAAGGITEYQALIVASMVEREARVPEERPLVAAVIYNRISAGMKLEIDATVQYALMAQNGLGVWEEELTSDDLAVDSLFNTRLYPGLPPGPICNPGVESIRAALEPAAVDYIYYVATGDEAGHHFFTSSYEEFLAAGG
jgi:UPF0755 protein